MSDEIAGVLASRASRAGVVFLDDAISDQLLTYYQLLARWNRTINLTSLSDPAEAVDRLLLEPLAAAQYLPRGEWLVDLGSGGGSPAVPLALATGATRLVMVESRTRKAAFLREVLRELALPGSVEAVRFEELVQHEPMIGAFGLASVRAVRLDAALFDTLASLLRTGATAALFGPASDAIPAGIPPSLRWIANHSLLSGASSLTRLQKL